MELSPGADLLLLTIDPATGKPVKHRRGRLRQALKALGSSRRRARAELGEAGLLANRAATAQRFRRLVKQAMSGEFEDARERELAVLLAWCGALAPRLSRDEWRIVYRRLRGSVPAPGRAGVGEAPLTGRAEPTEGIAALGAVAALGGGALLMGAVDSPYDLGGGFESSGGGDFGGA